MDNGIYIAAARQIALFRDMDVTAGNIANMSTAGYQSEHMMFKRYMVDDQVGTEMNFAHDTTTFRNTGQGALRVTDNTLDVAIKGDGYFVLQTPLGERYTRSGNFQINDTGTLVSIEGYPVLDQSNQPINLEDTIGELVIGGDGSITVGGDIVTSLGVVEFENQQLMERHGARLFSSEAEPIPSETSEVIQGALESSNVQAISQLTHMMSLSRATSSTAKYIEVMYDLQRRNTTTWTQQR